MTYYMSVFLIPKNFLKKIDAIRRAFFWTAEDTCSGAQCLIAWKNVCKPKKFGGLGIKNLHTQNKCLLMKFAVKSLLPSDAPWQEWLSLPHPNAFVAPDSNHSYLCKTINLQMPTLQKITFVLTNNGASTYFWLDTWLTQLPLAYTFPNLFSHSQVPLVRVANILRFGLDSNLRNRLTFAATQELVSLLSVLQDFMPSSEQDERFLLGGCLFSTKNAYAVLLREPDIDYNAPLIWRSQVPNKIKVFAWLLFRDRLNTRANLVHKHIITDSACPRCQLQPEDAIHLFISCPYAGRIWQRIGITPSSLVVSDLWDAPLPQVTPASVWPFVLLTILWKIWEARNDKLFRSVDRRSSSSCRLILSDLDLWSHRLLKPGDKEAVSSWRLFLSARCSVPM